MDRAHLPAASEAGGEKDLGALDKFQSLISMSRNINARVRNTWTYKIYILENEDENNKKKWERRDTEEYFGNSGYVLTTKHHYPLL